MKLLQDAQVEQLIRAGQVVTGIVGVSEKVKGCSVDLSIGDIFVPGTNDGLGSLGNPRKELALEQGQTAVVVTQERVEFSSNQAGIAFPPSRVSLQGVLMTNPGHIDPGYVGNLHVTVINMGREIYCLKKGDRILRMLIIELDSASTKIAQKSYSSPVDAELLNRLSHDFMNVKIRAESAARDEVGRAQLKIQVWQFVLPIITALIGVGAAWYGTTQKLEERMSKVEGLVPIVSRLDSLELQKIRDVDDRLKQLEASTKKK